METNTYSINKHNLIECLSILGILTMVTFLFVSCETENQLLEMNTDSVRTRIMTRGMNKPMPTTFFAYSDRRLEALIATLRDINDNIPFVTSFQEEYGMPLWDFAYTISEEEGDIYFVPIFDARTPLEIRSFWFFRISGGLMTYAPYKFDETFISDSEQRFIFDFLNYLVFGENNTSGAIFVEKAPQTRAWITVTRCWDVYTGTAEHLEFSYSNCIDTTYWIDEVFVWNSVPDPSRGERGSLPLTGGGGGSSGSGSQAIFGNDQLTEDTWKLLDDMLDEILDDCMGGNLYNEIKKQLNGDKVTIQIVDGIDSSYNWNTNTLSLNVNDLESYAYLHELIHLYQTLQETISSFENTLMNREIEAQYAQYLFLRKQPVWQEKYEEVYRRSQRGNAIINLDVYIDEHGSLQDESLAELAECFISENVVSALQMYEAYANYPFDVNQGVLQMFSNINVLTKNCD